MSTGRKKTLGQRFGLLTGFGLILGGVAGWGWSLLQSPGHAAVEPVPTPRPPEPSTTVTDSVHAAVETITAPVADVAEQVADAVEELTPDTVSELIPEKPSGDGDDADEPESGSESESEPESAATTPARPVDVPDAVKAIRAAAAAARERLETPVKPLTVAAETSSDTEVG